MMKIQMHMDMERDPSEFQWKAFYIVDNYPKIVKDTEKLYKILNAFRDGRENNK